MVLFQSGSFSLIKFIVMSWCVYFRRKMPGQRNIPGLLAVSCDELRCH